MGRRGLLTAANLPRLANEKVKSVSGIRHLLRVNPMRPARERGEFTELTSPRLKCQFWERVSGTSFGLSAQL